MKRFLLWLWGAQDDQTFDIGHWRRRGHHPLWSRDWAGVCRLCPTEAVL